MKTLPTGLLPRAAAAGRVALSLGRAAALRAVRTREDDDRALGEALVAELDQLKGLSMKVGQILSTLEVGLPDGTTEALARLQRGATPLDASQVRAELEDALGAPVAARFDAFDDAPVAAASIGQVHRARADGREVAVKVRYPGIRAALDADAVPIRRVASLAALATAVDGPALAAELHARLVEECDFRREAAWLAAVAPLGNALGIDVPAALATHSCESVLTTMWVDGARFEDLRAASDAERTRAAADLLRFTWTALFARGFLHADPHPGNFLFADRVTLLDWGCVRRFAPDEVEPFRALLTVLLADRRDRFRDALAATGTVPDFARYDLDAAWAMHRWMWAPYLAPTFRFEPAWALAGARFTGPTAPNQRTQAFPPHWIWLFRVTFGVHALLTRLGVTLPARDLLAAALAAPLDPLPDPVAALPLTTLAADALRGPPRHAPPR